MRRAFAACVAFAILMIVVVVRFGFKDPPEPRPIADAAVADAPIDAPVVIVDAAPTQKVPAAKPPPKSTWSAPKPVKPTLVQPTPVQPTVVIPRPTPVNPTPVNPSVKPRCTPPKNPAGCPATEPNVNRPCDAEGVHCIYGTSCCPFTYVCKDGAFEAWFSSCP